MLPFETLTAFAFVAFLLALAPGPDNLFVLTQSALNGARAGLVVVLGLCTGLVVHSLAVAFGVAALVKTSALAFNTLKIAGAAYLLYLAYQALMAQARKINSTATSSSPATLYKRGLIMNVTNPKVAIFFLSFFPQFTDPQRGNMILQISMLGVIFMAMTFFVFSAIALIAGRLSRLLMTSARAQVWMNRMASLVFFGLACKIMLSER